MASNTYMGITPDIQDNTGKWKKNVCLNKMTWSTLSYKRWRGIVSRCDPDGSEQKRNPRYIGCTNEFEGFQEFVEWNRKQIGYDLEDYQLDKDLLFKGNKIYSPDTCIMLPCRINYLLLKRNSKRGDYPIGVSFNNRKQKFEAAAKGVYLGYYESPETAFYVYKKYKENLIKQVAEEYKDRIDPKAYNALMKYEVEITD